MASAPDQPLPIVGRIDRDGRLIEADRPLERLQQAAGSALGRLLALPQLAALARSAQSLGVPLSRAVLAADEEHDLDLWVRAEPDAEGVTVRIERWAGRAPAAARLSLVGSLPSEEGNQETTAPALAWTADSELRFVQLSAELATILGCNAEEAVGQPLTRLLRLVEDEDGRLPLLTALAARAPLADQRARARSGDQAELTLSAQPLLAADGRFEGFEGVARLPGQAGQEPTAALVLDEALDEALRSPLDRIITAADRIVERSDGPLRSDYASYASDIGAAGRHLLSVIRSMSDEVAADPASVDLGAVVGEAAGLVEQAASLRGVDIVIDRPEQRMLARGESRGVVQILVNMLGNAIRHSPEGGTVAVVFDHVGDKAAVTVADQGPGIARADQQRIFERYEQVAATPGGSGLGLAISRRLARAMDGDVQLESAPGEGARFTLLLPIA